MEWVLSRVVEEIRKSGCEHGGNVGWMKGFLSGWYRRLDERVMRMLVAVGRVLEEVS